MNNVDIIIICSPYYDGTPVIKWYAEFIEGRGFHVKKILLSEGRFKFIYKSYLSVLKSKNSQLIVLVGFQSLPILLLSWIIKRKWVYWKLESCSPFDNASLATKLQLFEYIINRKDVLLVLPNKQRGEIQNPKFENLKIVYNAPVIDKLYKKINKKSDIKNKFLIYGNLKKKSTFISEIKSIFYRRGDIKLDIIGNCDDVDDLPNNINYIGYLSHDSLIEKLKYGYHYSFIGYNDSTLNNKFAAPNKLAECLFLGIPVIGHNGNPFVCEIINRYQCGFLLDFRNIDKDFFDYSINFHSDHLLKTFYAAESLSLNQSIKDTILEKPDSL